MPDDSLHGIEQALRISLPQSYCAAFRQIRSQGDELPEFETDPDQLIALNPHFTLDPEDLSDLRGTGLLGRIRFFLLYKSPRVLVEQRRRFKQKWAGAGRFVIGTDLGEEQYFILLRDPDSKVYCNELETDRVREIAPDLDSWILHARANAREA